MCDGSGDFGMIGGAGGPCYNNLYNTTGMGDVIPAGINSYGSGDLFYPNASNKKKKRNSISNIATKKAAPVIGNFDDFVSTPKGGFGMGDLPLFVPSKPNKK